ncbi:MAG: hypothetical protein IJ111_02265 [Eggerthellaceae bacterium]|nr:hypothetical protein [Eggerthellaceae bacterium]
MIDYKQIAVEAVITLSVVADYESGDFDKRLAARANTLAMKLGILDLEEEKAKAVMPARKETARKPKPVPLPAGPEFDDELKVTLKKPDAVPKAAPKKNRDDGGMKVTVLQKTEPKPLPNEHPLNLKGSGRSAKPALRFRMREKDGGTWFEGTATECARRFSVQPSLIYKWANGMNSQKYDLEKI